MKNLARPTVFKYGLMIVLDSGLPFWAALHLIWTHLKSHRLSKHYCENKFQCVLIWKHQPYAEVVSSVDLCEVIIVYGESWTAEERLTTLLICERVTVMTCAGNVVVLSARMTRAGHWSVDASWPVQWRVAEMHRLTIHCRLSKKSKAIEHVRHRHRIARLPSTMPHALQPSWVVHPGGRTSNWIAIDTPAGTIVLQISAVVAGRTGAHCTHNGYVKLSDCMGTASYSESWTRAKVVIKQLLLGS